MTAITMEKKSGFSIPKEELQKFANWALVWLFLANIGYMGMWFVGAPPRYAEIALIGFAGLILRRFNYWAKLGVFVTLMVYSMISFVGGLFNLNIKSLVYSLQFFAELNIDASFEYIIVACLAVATMIASIWLLRRDAKFSNPWLILAGGLMVIGLAVTDEAIGDGMRGHYKREAPAGAFYESAAGQTNFAARADGKRHLILIMVESLGVPKDNKVMSDKLFAYYNNSAIKNRYDVSQGTSLYYNSTTAGEFREMCGGWGDYYQLLDPAEAKAQNCLPQQLAAKGYATHAMHSFKGGFFARSEWYPNIGFQKREFWEDLEPEGIEYCGGVFAGACDRQIPERLAQHLKKAEKPTFMYWLTLNAHLPVPTGKNLETENCEKVSPELAKDFPMICRQFSLFDDIDKAVVKQITASDFPEADILIVGDHMPPYYDRHHRSQFDPEHVPWLYLKAKDRAPTEAEPATVASAKEPSGKKASGGV